MMLKKTSKPGRGQRGVTLIEILVIVGMIGVIMLFAVPLTANQLQRAHARSTVNEFTMALRAARMMAVTQQTPIDVTVEDTPDNKYSYTDGNGNFREFELAQSVSITASDTPISFARNGASGGTTTTIVADLPGGHTDTYTVTTTNLGMVEVSKVRN